MGLQQPLHNEVLPSISSRLFSRSPGLTLDDLTHLECHQQTHLSSLEAKLTQAQPVNNYLKLTQIALHLIQSSPDATLYKITSHSSIIPDKLSLEKYNPLWEKRLKNNNKDLPLECNASISELKAEIDCLALIIDPHANPNSLPS